MRIIILGAGQVGATLASNLAREDNDITLVDVDEHRLGELQHKLDIRTVHGLGSHPSVLISAGIEQADMLIAVTRNDEVNIMACQVAYSLFRTPMKIARIRSRHYYDYPELFLKGQFSIDVCISPEKLVTKHIENLINYPETTQVLDFAEGKALIVSIKPQAGGKMLHKSLEDLYQYLPEANFRVLTIFRAEEVISPSDYPEIVANDLILLIATPESVQPILTALGRQGHPNRRIMIAGGGQIGAALAQALENQYRVKIIESNAIRANELASELFKTTVLHGNIVDRDLLRNENIEFTDVFCAVSNDDENNIMSCLQAKRLGAGHVMTIINRPAYVELIEDSTIDQAISPHLITIGFILTKIRGGNMVKIHKLHHDEAEIIELIIHGDEKTSQVIGRACSEIGLPSSCHIAALVREEKVLMATDSLIIHSGDHIILLLLKRRHVRQVESLFQVALTFMG